MSPKLKSSVNNIRTFKTRKKSDRNIRIVYDNRGIKFIKFNEGYFFTDDPIKAKVLESTNGIIEITEEVNKSIEEDNK